MGFRRPVQLPVSLIEQTLLVLSSPNRILVIMAKQWCLSRRPGHKQNPSEAREHSSTLCSEMAKRGGNSEATQLPILCLAVLGLESKVLFLPRERFCFLNSCCKEVLDCLLQFSWWYSNRPFMTSILSQRLSLIWLRSLKSRHLAEPSN